MSEEHKQKGPQAYTAADASDIIVVPVWWRWDPMFYDKDKYSVEPAKDDPIWEQPEWGKPVYEHPDGWTPEPPQDKPAYPPMHYKPWEPKPEHQHHHAKKNGHSEKSSDPKPHHEAEPHQHQKHGHKDYVPPHDHDVPYHVHSVPGYPEPQNPNNININIDINNSSNSNSNSNSNAEANASATSVAKAMAGSLSFAASHSHGGSHDRYHEDCDDLFDWGEATYKDIMPTHKDSYAIEDYYARIYDNGQAVGEKNGKIYHYDGENINLVGTVDEVADWAGIEVMTY
jgi:hypothetical protein